jgi:hypothetical protein
MVLRNWFSFLRYTREEYLCCQNSSPVAARAEQSDTGPKVLPDTWGIAIAVIASRLLEVHIFRLSW